MKPQRHGIHAANIAALIVLLIGLPAAATASLGPWRLSSPAQLHTLQLAGCALAAALNLMARAALARTKKTKSICNRWIAVHAALAALQWLLLEEILAFDWLKSFLRSLQ